jgi:hypothetical protein
VEPAIPHRRFLVAPVVDWATHPLPSGRRERSAPVRPRRFTRSPGCGSISPWGPVEVATLGIPMPWRGATGSAWVTRFARPTGSARVFARPTGSARVIGRPTGSARVIGRPTGSGWATGSARVFARATGSGWATGSAGVIRSARIVGSVLGVEVSGRRPARVTAGSARGRRAMAAGWSWRWRSWSGVC